MPMGGTLTIAVEAVEFDRSTAGMTPGASPGPYVLLQVTDTGGGIPAHIVDRIFDPFFTTKAVGKGTGLGLSTVIGIAKSHGGFVNLVTKEGKGSVFQVYLPAVPEGREPAEEAAAAAAPSGTGEVILVADDEENIREVTRSILSSHGYEVVTARDGADAAAKYAQRRSEIRAVITDLDMPIMDGVMLVRVLQEMNPSVAVIVSSGMASKHGMESRIAELKSLGVTTILKKPYTVERMLEVIHRAIAGIPAGKAPAELHPAGPAGGM
jgi:CheY-like chemotaxis protein